VIDLQAALLQGTNQGGKQNRCMSILSAVYFTYRSFSWKSDTSRPRQSFLTLHIACIPWIFQFTVDSRSDVKMGSVLDIEVAPGKSYRYLSPGNRKASFSPLNDAIKFLMMDLWRTKIHHSFQIYSQMIINLPQLSSQRGQVQTSVKSTRRKSIRL
jgi:hypothetical protein